MRFNSIVFVFLILFGDRIRWYLNGDTIASRLRSTWLLLHRGHQVGRDVLHQTFDTIATSGIVVGIEFFAALAIVNVEGIVLIAVVILHLRIGNAYQFDDLQAGPWLLLGIIAERNCCLFLAFGPDKV